AVNCCVAAQHTAGGWNDREPRRPGKLSASVWAIQALKEAQYAGLNVPNATFAGAGQFLDRLASADGTSFRDTPDAKPTTNATAAGLLAPQIMFLTTRHPFLDKGARQLRRQPPTPATKDLFYYYCATQVMDWAGPAHWQFWEPRLQQLLVDSQDQGL